MNLIAEAAGFGQGTFTLRCQQLENRRIVFQQDPWQSVGLLANEQSYGIQLIRFAGLVSATTTHGGPAGVDLVDGFAASHQVLGETAAVASGTLDAPLSRFSETG